MAETPELTECTVCHRHYKLGEAACPFCKRHRMMVAGGALALTAAGVLAAEAWYAYYSREDTGAARSYQEKHPDRTDGTKKAGDASNNRNITSFYGTSSKSHGI